MTMKNFRIQLTSLILVLLPVGLSAQEIFQAIRSEDLAQVESIIEKSPDQLNVVRGLAYTPLSYASMLGDIRIVDYLISKGALVINANNSLKSPIFNAVYRGHLNVVQKLVKSDADLEQQTIGMSLLHTAVMRNHIEIVEYLLSVGTNINKRDLYGLSPLHIAVELGHSEICSLLMARGADLNVRCHLGATPLHLSDEAEQRTISDLLTSSGAKELPRDFPKFHGLDIGKEYPGFRLEPFPLNKILRVIGPHSGVAVSGDRNEIFWVRGDFSGKLWHMQGFEGVWKPSGIVSFAEDFTYSYPSFAPDGERLYFTSDKQNEGRQYKAGIGDIWYLERTDDGWSKPKNCGETVNTDGDEFIASVDRENNLYFTRVVIKNGKANADIYVSEFADGAFQTAVPMGNDVNSPRHEVGPQVSPDGRYLIYGSQRSGEMKTYISFREKSGGWTDARDIQSIFAPFERSYVQGISGDGDLIFFAGKTELRWDLYWISADAVKKGMH
jgi:hypothetical protein